jgi:ammonia channel protein AmtB
MNKPLVLAAAVLGVIFLVLACVYWFVPAGSLPNFMPGFADGSTHVHVKHGLVALVLALVLLGFAWAKREG